MRARLRTVWASWRRSLLVLIGCLTYIALVQATVRLFPSVAPSLGHVWLIIAVVYFLAAYAAGFVGIYMVGAVVAGTLTRVLTRAFPETPWAKRSDKAKEKFADSLLSVSNAVASATAIAVLVVPFTAFVQAMATQRDLGVLLSPLLKPGGLPGWQVVVLMGLFFLPLAVSVRFRKKAMDIYDEITRKATPELSLGPNGATPAAHACPASMGTPPPAAGRPAGVDPVT
jgi:hypothetical protein